MYLEILYELSHPTFIEGSDEFIDWLAVFERDNRWQRTNLGFGLEQSEGMSSRYAPCIVFPTRCRP